MQPRDLGCRAARAIVATEQVDLFRRGGLSFLQLYRWLCHNFRLVLLLSGSRLDALKRAQLDHLCTHTLKGP